MSAEIKTAAWKLAQWAAARLAAPRLCPIPLSGVRGQIEAFLHSPQGAMAIAALAAAVLYASLRSAWFDIYGRWYGR